MNEEELLSPTTNEFAPTILARQLLDSWKDRDYRDAFVCERVRSSVALQIRALREQRNKMTQTRLGDAIGMAQTWISRLEDPEYGKMTVATLLRLANAFDADLEIKFRPFSRALDELSKQGPGYFIVPSFADELPSLEDKIQNELARYVAITLVPPARRSRSNNVISGDEFEQTRKALGGSRSQNTPQTQIPSPEVPFTLSGRMPFPPSGAMEGLSGNQINPAC